MIRTLRPVFGAAACAAGFALFATPASADDVKDLMAGQHTDIGEVTVCDDGSDIFVTYDATNGAFLSTTHLYLSTTEPRKHAPGRFPYKNEGIWTETDEYSIALSDLSASAGDTLYVAAHANTTLITGFEDPLLYELDLDIPDSVTISSSFPGGDSYWETTVSGGGPLDGTYDAWCVDTDRTMSPGATHTADVYTSYEAAAAGFVESPENLDQVNWILNQDFVGQASPTCSGSYTFGDVQRSIWTLVEDNLSGSGLGSWSQCRVNEIVAGAVASGEGFEPGCLEQMAVMLVPVNAAGSPQAQIIVAQVLVIEVDLECAPILGGDETAWGDGDLSFRRSWASYWEYEVGSATCD